MTRPRLTHALKSAAASTLYYSGSLRVWQSLALRSKTVVLMYHRVLNEDDRRQTGSHPGIVVGRETFAKQMAVLKRRFTVISAEHLAESIERKRPLPSSSCVITFDDGWRDNYTNALPILRELELPAIIFLPVNYIGSRRLFWRESLTHLLVRAVTEARHDSGRRAHMRSILAPAGLEAVLAVTAAEPRPAIIEIVDSARTLTWAASQPLLSALSRELGVEAEVLATPDTFIDWVDAEHMARYRVSFGGHGAEHRLLTELSIDQAHDEIAVSKNRLTEKLGTAVQTFSYPNGAWTPAIAERVKATGFRLAFTTQPGFVSCDDDPYSLRRVNIHQDVTATTPMFLARVVGLF